MNFIFPEKMILEGPFRLTGDERYSAGSFDVSENFIFSFEFKMSVLPENKTFNVLRRVSSKVVPGLYERTSSILPAVHLRN